MSLIDTDALIEALNMERNLAEYTGSYGIESGLARAVAIVQQTPAAGENKVGFWRDYYKCSICGFMPDCCVDRFRYCPRCGARMKI